MGVPIANSVHLDSPFRAVSMRYELPLTSMIGLGLISLSSALILANQDQNEKRFCLLAYLFQYIGAIFLLIRIFSFQILFIIFLTGLMGAAIIGTDQIDFRAPIQKKYFISFPLFRVFLSILIWGLILSIEPRIALWIPIPDSILFASLWMISIGIVKVSLDNDYFSMMLGLLNLFFGFQLVYILLEESSLVFGFLTAINLLITLLGAFILLKPNSEQEEQEFLESEENS